jgi:hypothetical protein
MAVHPFNLGPYRPRATLGQVNPPYLITEPPVRAHGSKGQSGHILSKMNFWGVSQNLRAYEGITSDTLPRKQCQPEEASDGVETSLTIVSNSSVTKSTVNNSTQNCAALGLTRIGFANILYLDSWIAFI